MADRLRIGFRHFAAPHSVCQSYRNIRAAVRVKHHFRVGYLLPAAAVKNNTAVFRVEIVGYCESIVFVNIYMAAKTAS